MLRTGIGQVRIDRAGRWRGGTWRGGLMRTGRVVDVCRIAEPTQGIAEFLLDRGAPRAIEVGPPSLDAGGVPRLCQSDPVFVEALARRVEAKNIPYLGQYLIRRRQQVLELDEYGFVAMHLAQPPHPVGGAAQMLDDLDM